MKYSSLYGGKVEVIPKVPVQSLEDFSIWYTPGVADVSLEISANCDESFRLTNRWNTIAVATNGTRVLGLGDIGPEASLPVMEGKALIFKYLGGVDAFPLPINASDPDKFIEVIKCVEPAFGGINLEDVRSPDCFYILERLTEELKIPVWHDDQLGTASATLAALINALKVVGKDPKEVEIVFFGAGASNIATANLLIRYGFDPGNMILIDSQGTLHPDRPDMDSLMLKNRWKYELAIKTNGRRVVGGLEEAVEGADVLIAASRPGPGVISRDHVSRMADSPIIFALANPVPEILPEEAYDAGAKIVATGRSDYPNQVNNSLIFPSVFRGALDVRATKITPEAMIAASRALAIFAQERGISETYIVPTMQEWEAYSRVAASVASELSSQGAARFPASYDEELERASKIISRARNLLESLISTGIVQRLSG